MGRGPEQIELIVLLRKMARVLRAMFLHQNDEFHLSMLSPISIFNDFITNFLFWEFPINNNKFFPQFISTARRMHNQV